MNLTETIPEFDLIGTDNQQHKPSEYDDKEAVAMIFTCNHCPHARSSVDRISDLVDRYGDRVGFFAISSNDVEKYPSDSFEDMIPMADLMNLNSRYLYDESQDIAKAFDYHANSYLVKPFQFDELNKMIGDLGFYWMAWNRSTGT